MSRLKYSLPLIGGRESGLQLRQPLMEAEKKQQQRGFKRNTRVHKRAL